MTFDPFIFSAQIVNFVVLLGLLKHFLYGPILNAINSREEAYTQRRDELEQMEKTLSRACEEFESEKESFRAEVDSILQEAKREAREVKAQELEKARLGVESLENHWLANLRQKQDALVTEIRERVAKAGFQIAGRVLCDVSAEESVQEAAFHNFLTQVSDLHLTGEVLVRSAHKLTDSQRASLLDLWPDARFEVDPALILGCELVHQGVRHSLHAEAQVDALETEFGGLLERGFSL